VSAAGLAAAEERLAEMGQRIPESYKAFLAHHDGGVPVRDHFSFQRDDKTERDRVHVFLGVAPVPSPGANLVKTVGLLGERLPSGVLPIAEDPFGNLICLDNRDGRDGPVLFWDHEYEGEPPDEANLYEIAPDLQTFLDSLYEDPDPPAVAQQQTGRRRLFGRHA
jgi:cell wall assembly regulator SMI1